jgi:hypothetical protein
MATIAQDDLITSVADALQFISYYHPVDYIRNLTRAYELEQSAAAKDAMAQILVNSRASGISEPGQHAARLGPGRSGWRAPQHARQHPSGDPRLPRAG